MFLFFLRLYDARCLPRQKLWLSVYRVIRVYLSHCIYILVAAVLIFTAMHRACFSNSPSCVCWRRIARPPLKSLKMWCSGRTLEFQAKLQSHLIYIKVSLIRNMNSSPHAPPIRYNKLSEPCNVSPRAFKNSRLVNRPENKLRHNLRVFMLRYSVQFINLMWCDENRKVMTIRWAIPPYPCTVGHSPNTLQ
jgi:hypothetical protein